MIFSVLFAMPALLSPAPAQLPSRTRGARMAAPEGDASSLPTSKTGAAVRKQAPTLVENLLAVRREAVPQRCGL